MLKRLLTAVLVLGLFLALSGTAFTAPKDVPKDHDFQARPRTAWQVTGSDVFTQPMNRATSGVSDGVPNRVQTVPMHRNVNGSDTMSCEEVGYADWAGASYFITFSRRSNSAMTEMGTRFDGPSKPLFAIKVKGVEVGLKRASQGVVTDGHTQIVARVYTNVAGLPGTLLYSETFAIPVFIQASGWNYYYLPFTTPVVTSASYIITVGPDLTRPSTDTTVFVSDDAGYPSIGTATYAGRTVLKNAGTFYTADLFYPSTGTPTFRPGFDIYSDFCQVYTNCYTQETEFNGANVALYSCPSTNPAYVHELMGFGQRFTSAPGPDTVKTAWVWHYSYGGTYPGTYYGPTSTNYFIVKVWKDDGTGNIDYASGPVATQNGPTTAAGLFPNTGIAANGYNFVPVTFTNPPVVYGPWHVTVECANSSTATGRFLFLLTDPTNDPGRSGGSATFIGAVDQWKRLGQSPEWTGRGWGEQGVMFDVDLCKDEYALCATQNTSGDAYYDYYGGMPGSGYSRRAWAQMISGTGLPTRLDKFRFQLDPKQGTPEFEARVYSVVSGAPGSVLYSKHLTTADLTYWPGWTEVVIPGGLQVGPGDYFVGLEMVAPSTLTDLIFFLSDDGTVPLVNGGVWQISNSDGLWHSRASLGDPINGVFQAEYCSVPAERWTCTGTPLDMTTEGYDFARTGHSQVALSDAYCDLNLRWKFEDLPLNASLIASAGPIVHDTFVVCAFGNKYRILSLNTGANLATINGTGSPYYIAGSGLNVTPTVAMVTIGGTPKPILFVFGGSLRSVTALDLSDWTTTPGFPNKIWSVNSSNYAAMGYTSVSHIGNTAYANAVVMNVGGTDMLFFATNDLYLWAANAATGMKIWGYTLDGLSNKGLASDGTYLYVATTALATGNPYGDIVCLNPADGTVKWDMVPGVTAGPLQGEIFFPNGTSGEGFASGLAVNNGTIFTVSTFLNPVSASGYTADGLFYRIKSADGSVLSVTKAMHAYTGGGNTVQGTPMVDAAQVVVPSRSTWGTPTMAGSLLAYNRFTGGLNWARNTGQQSTVYGHRADGLMTCEAMNYDLLFVTNIGGYLACLNATTGDEIFNRRFDNGATAGLNYGAGIGISKAGDLLVATRIGQIFCLTKGADRQRLDITNYNLTGNTYGPAPSINITFPGVFKNTGCLPLTLNVTLSNVSNGTTLGAAPGPLDAWTRHSSIADALTSGSTQMLKGMYVQTDELSDAIARPELNKAAAAVPYFINGTGVVGPITIAPGATADLTLDVKQSAIVRGPNACYGYVSSDDPDFFLNDVTKVPQIYINIVGGCLNDTTTLHFGTGANYQLVMNHGRIGNGDWSPFHIGDGALDADFYGGFYIYGVTKYRIAMNSQDWWTGGGETNAWKAMQADPNACTHNCKPGLQSGVTLGQIWNGTAYIPFMGNVVCRTYLDSVQTWDVGGVWNWNNWTTAGQYNNDSTMGLMVNSKVVGFTTVPTGYEFLNNVTVDIMKIYQRDNKALPNWRMGQFTDFDMGGDTAIYFNDLSIAANVGTGGRTTGVWGVIKLPYGGCGAGNLPSMINAKACASAQSINSPTGTAPGNLYLDSAYAWMGLANGGYSQGNMAGNDNKFHASFIKHDFTVGDTLTFAIAEFGFPTVANPKNPATLAPLSKTLNKWLGYDRGDVNGDGIINLADIVYLADFVNGGGPGPLPFKTVGDVNADDLVNAADYTYLIDYYFHYGTCPQSKMVLPAGF